MLNNESIYKYKLFVASFFFQLDEYNVKSIQSVLSSSTLVAELTMSQRVMV